MSAPTRVALALAALLAVFFLAAGHEVLTGDEPRYLMYARCFLQHGRFVMTLPEWQHLMRLTTGERAAPLPTGAHGAVLMHAVYLPALLSPIAAFGLPALRAATLLAGLGGVAALAALTGLVARPWAAALATATAALGIPLLPYLHIFYMEAWLFALLAAAWLRLQTPARPLGGDLLTAALILAMPFVHLRGACCAAVLFLLLLVANRARPARLALLLALAAAAFALLVGLNERIYGALTGPVNTARPMRPDQWFAVVSMQLFNVRHGLLAYAPVWMLGASGLLAGSLRGVRLAREGLALLVVAVLTGVGVNPGECWPARFWVLSVPMLAVGLAFFVEAARGVAPRLLLAALLAITALAMATFVLRPNSFLNNRQGSETWQAIAKKTGRFDPALLLPVETDDPADAHDAALLTAGAAILVLAAAASAAGRPAAAVVGLAVLLAAADVTQVARLRTPTFAVMRSPHLLVLTFARPVRSGFLQFNHPEQVFFGPPGFPRFTVTATGALGSLRSVVPARDVLAFSCRDGVRRVTVASDARPSLVAASAPSPAVYRSRSFLRNLPGEVARGC